MDIRDFMQAASRAQQPELRAANLNDLMPYLKADAKSRVFKEGDIVVLREKTVEDYKTPKQGERVIITHVMPATVYLIERGSTAARADFIGAFVDDQHNMLVEFPFDGRDFEVVDSIHKHADQLAAEQPAAE